MFSSIKSIVLLCTVISTALSAVLPDLKLAIPEQNSSDATLHADAIQRAKVVAQKIRNSLDKKVNSSLQENQPSSLNSGKKAAATIYLQEGSSTGGIQFNDIRDIIPIVVDNVINPLIKRVLIRENAFTLFGGWPSWGATEAPVASTATPQKTYIDLTIEVDESTTSKPSPPPKKGKVTTTEKSITNSRDLLDENTTLPSKTKYRVRVRDRTRRTTEKPVGTTEDDEDESGVLDKLKHLRKSS